MSYVDEKGDKTRCRTIQFYGRGEEMVERRFVYEGQGKYDLFSYHSFLQQVVVPWSEGENLWSAIHHPSEKLKDYTKADCGFEWNDKRWYKPAEKTEADVIKFPTLIRQRDA